MKNWISLIVILLGFLFIILGLYLAYERSEERNKEIMIRIHELERHNRDLRELNGGLWEAYYSKVEDYKGEYSYYE